MVLFKLKARTTPRTIQLNTLAVNVAIGKPEACVEINRDKPYLQILPKPPPKKTNRKDFIKVMLKKYLL